MQKQYDPKFLKQLTGYMNYLKNKHAKEKFFIDFGIMVIRKDDLHGPYRGRRHGGGKKKEEGSQKGRGRGRKDNLSSSLSSFPSPAKGRGSRSSVTSTITMISTSSDEIGRAVQQECRDRSRMPSSA
eukprot:TRINITY_DN29336_c0_g1_i1.p1 TRINITY_DN29336_c0_g1~~TRINITY_DN29336_c0_g1_i1.p1  ORF type:complete len:127 (+),score=7.58 TRINITY_DN29336_c0_g1_i1:233-613(+)